jgi:drug/metabolite transporter (DMT)-like permease
MPHAGAHSGREWLRRAAAFVALTIVWSTTWHFIKLGVDAERVPPFAFAAVRMLLSAAVMLIVLRVRGERLPRPVAEWRAIGTTSLFMISIPYALIYVAERRLPSGLPAVINAMVPVLVSLMAHAQLEDDRLTPRKALGTAIAFGGVALLNLDAFRFGDQGITLSVGFLLSGLASLCAATSTAFATVQSKRQAHTSSALVTTTVQFLVGGAALALLAAATEVPAMLAWRPTAAAIGALLYLTLLGSCLAFTLFFWLLRHVKATSVSLISYLIPFLAVSCGALFDRDPITPWLVLGLAAILGGAALVQFGSR